MSARTVTISIARPARTVYAFVSDPLNLPSWAGAFCRAVRRAGDAWVVETPDGPMGLRFVAPNDLGVLDHYVTPASGQEIFVPMRVIPKGDGCEVIVTVLPQPGMSYEALAADAALVRRDLETLRTVLEQ